MGKAKKTRKFAVAKKIISPKDTRVRENLEKAKQKEEQLKKKAEPKQVEQANSALFFQYNTQLGPPYHVLVDTNFINFSIRYVIRKSDHQREPCSILTHQNYFRNWTQKKTGHGTSHDGLFAGKVRTMHNKLCYG